MNERVYRFLPDSWTEKPAFGTALEEHLKRSNREIALPIEACVMMLLETGMKEEVQSQTRRARSLKTLGLVFLGVCFLG